MKKIYCTITTISLRVCKSITIHKAQGISIGSGKPFESVIVSLPKKGKRTNTCSEIVTFSRVKDISALATCGTKNGVILEKLKKIGIGSSYIKIKQFYRSLIIK